MQQFSAEQIAQVCGGKVIGNIHIKIDSFAEIESAKKNQISFLNNLKYEKYLYTTEAGIILLNETYQLKSAIQNTIILVKDAYIALAKLIEYYQSFKKNNKIGIETNVYIHTSAKMGNNIYIGSFSYISENVIIGNDTQIYPQTYIGENVIIGNNTIIYAGVKIYHGVQIGDNVIIHAGTVIGSDGFGFAQSNSTFQKIAQLGNVIIENDVEIGSNVTIDRATLGSTIIKRGAKLDNQIQIAHNVVIGENTAIAAQVGISGSTKIGNNVLIGGQSGLAGHLQIADNVKLAGGTGVTKSILEPNSIFAGFPAIPIKDWQKNLIYIKRIPQIEKTIEELKIK